MRKTVLNSALLLLMATSVATAQRDTVFTWSRSLPEGSRFAIRNLNGPIDIREGTTDRVEVRAVMRVEARGVASDVSFDVRESAANDIEICTLFRGTNCGMDNMWEDVRLSVSFTVDLPKGLRLRATTGNGSIIVMQSAAEVDVRTGNGDVVIRESLGTVGAVTGNGDVTIAAAEGVVTASTGNGNVVVVSRAPVNARSGNGDIDVKVGALRAHDLTPMTITTGHGEVRVALPANFSGELDATSGTNRIKTNFDVRSQGRHGDSSLRGPIGSGAGPLVKVHSGAGRVEIVKR